MSTDTDILARTLYGEAEPRDEADLVAIAWVVRNRVALKPWPNDVRSVCLQPKQFSCWNADNPRLGKIKSVTEADPWFARCLAVAADVLADRIPDPTERATHYHATYVSPKWARGKTPCYSTPAGKFTHLFYNDIDTPAPPKAPVPSMKPPAEKPAPKPRTKKRTAGEWLLALMPAAGSALEGWHWLAILAAGAVGIVGLVVWRWLERRKR